MKAFVTGGSGFLGSHLVRALLERNYEVSCLVRKTSDLTWLKELPVKFVQGNLSSDDTGWAGELSGSNVIFNVAGKVAALSRDEFFRVNARGPERLASLITEKNPGILRLVHISSLAAQGPGTGTEPVTEQWNAPTVNLYGASKQEGEKRILDYVDRIPLTIIRPGAIFGPRDRSFLDVFQTACRGIRLGIWGRPKVINMGFVRDIVDGVIRAGETDCPSGEIFLLGDRINYNWDEVTRLICAMAGRKGIQIPVPIPFLYLGAGLSEIVARLRGKPSILCLDKVPDMLHENWALDPGKAVRILGYQPQWDFAQAAKVTLDWYQEAGWI